MISHKRTYIETLHLNIGQGEAGILDHFAVLAVSRKHNERDSWKNHSNSDDAAQRLQRLVRTILSFQTVNFVAPTKINRRCLISRFPMSQAEQYRHNGQDERTDHARFGTHRSSRQPL